LALRRPRVVIRRMSIEEAKREGKRVPRCFEVAERRGARITIIDDPAPIALIMGGLMFFGKTAGMTLLSNVIEDVTSPVSNMFELAVRGKVIDLRRTEIEDSVLESFKYQAFAPTKEDSSGVNYDEAHLRDTIYNLAKATLFLTTLVSDDAGELAMETLSEAMSQAVYSGVAGQLQNQANYRSGFIPPQSLHTEDEYSQVLTPTRAIMDAFGGYQIHETVTSEALRRIRQSADAYRRFRLLDDLGESLETSRLTHIAWLSEAGRLIRQAFRDLIEDVRAMLYTLLRRVTDVLAEVMVAKADYDAGLITQEEFNVVLLDANIELQKIDEECDNIIDDMVQAISEMPTSLDTVASKIASAYESAVSLFGDYVDSAILSDFGDYVTNLLNLRIYTKVKDIGYYLSNPVTGSQWGASK